MKKHVKVLASLGLTMPLTLTSVQASSELQMPQNLLKTGVQSAFVESNEISGNAVLNRISNFAVDEQGPINSGHVNVHNDNKKEGDQHTDNHIDTNNGD